MLPTYIDKIVSNTVERGYGSLPKIGGIPDDLLFARDGYPSMFENDAGGWTGSSPRRRCPRAKAAIQIGLIGQWRMSLRAGPNPQRFAYDPAFHFLSRPKQLPILPSSPPPSASEINQNSSFLL
jgi:hypothetical protein